MKCKSAEPTYVFSKDWTFELKYDGSRQLYFNGSLLSEREIDNSRKFSHIAEALKGLNVVLDGEMHLEGGVVSDLAMKKNWSKAKYCVFDILKYNGEDLRGKKLSDRLLVLVEVVKKIDSPDIHMPKRFRTFRSGWRYVIENDLEGIIAKHLGSTYSKKPVLEGFRSPFWLKIKNWKEGKEEVVSHDAGSRHGAFVLANGSRISALTESFVREFEDLKKKGDKVFAEFEYLEITRHGHYRMPTLKRLVR